MNKQETLEQIETVPMRIYFVDGTPFFKEPLAKAAAGTLAEVERKPVAIEFVDIAIPLAKQFLMYLVQRARQPAAKRMKPVVVTRFDNRRPAGRGCPR